MKPRSNRSDPAAVKAPQNPHHDNSGYRVPVLRPFPAPGFATLFRVFYAISGLNRPIPRGVVDGFDNRPLPPIFLAAGAGE